MKWSLLFTHKLDTCCQAMCQEDKTAKNPAFHRRRIINRLDSVTVCTYGANSNKWSALEVFYYFDFLIQSIQFFLQKQSHTSECVFPIFLLLSVFGHTVFLQSGHVPMQEYQKDFALSADETP